MPIIKTPISTIDPSMIEGLKAKLNPNYGNTLIEHDCEKILIIRAPVSNPDPVNDLEKGVAQLDNFDVKLDRIILIGEDNSISIDGNTSNIVLSRMKKNANRAKYKIKKETAAPQAQAVNVTDAIRELDAQAVHEQAPPALNPALFHSARTQLPSFMVRRARAQPVEQIPAPQQLAQREMATAPQAQDFGTGRAMERDFRPESVESDGQLAQAAGWKVSGHAPAPQAQGIAQRRQKNAEYDIFEEKFEEALREKGFMIFDISSTNLHSDKKRGVIAARKAGYPKKMLLRFCDYCSGAEVEKISLVADALDVDFCLMVYKEVDGRALRSSLGRKVELISRGFSNEFLELM